MTLDVNVPANHSLYALIIGINNYKHCSPSFQNLQGCVADADDMSQFLTQSVGIPNSQIINLRNEQATRTAILQHLRSFVMDERICMNDPILIYFAGHGAQTNPPEGWYAGGEGVQIEMLLPYDFLPQTSTDENSQGILDMMLRSILTEIANAKGNNITVIFDSCHSGSSTRVEKSDPNILVRGVTLPEDYAILPSILSEDSRIATVLDTDQNDGLASHVLLAACSKDDVAREIYGRGQFTKAVTEVLRENYTDTLTYIDLMNLLPDLLYQIPQCEGKYRDRILFNGQAPDRHRELYPVEQLDKGRFKIQAGEVHGVTKGAIFNIYASSNTDFTPAIEGLIAVKANVYSTILQSPGSLSLNQNMPNINSSSRVLLTHIGDEITVNIAFPFKDAFAELFQSIIDKIDDDTGPGHRIKPVEDEEGAELTVAATTDSKGQYAEFYINDRLCRETGLRSPVSLPRLIPLNAEGIFPVLSHAAHFFWALRHSKKSDSLGLMKSVTLEAYKLTGLSSRLKPIGDNLNVEGIIRITVEDGARYGFSIQSIYKQPLYAWLFSFNMSDLTIDIIYQPNFAKNNKMADPCLRPHNGELNIGYGAAGSEPQSFFLPANMDMDVTYLKLFLTTQYVDLSHLNRQISFEHRKSLSSRPELWDAILVPIIQKKKI